MIPLSTEEARLQQPSNHKYQGITMSRLSRNPAFPAIAIAILTGLTAVPAQAETTKDRILSEKA